MFPKIEMVRKALENLYDDVIVSGHTYEKIADEITGITEIQKCPLAIDGTPCRLNVSSSDRNPVGYSGAQPGTTAQEITLYLNPDIPVKPGTTLVVRTSDGTERTYEAASVPVIYSHHQEISLKLMEKRP